MSGAGSPQIDTDLRKTVSPGSFHINLWKSAKSVDKVSVACREKAVWCSSLPSSFYFLHLSFMRCCNSLRLSTVVATAVLAFVYCAPFSAAGLREYPVMASSADDTRLR